MAIRRTLSFDPIAEANRNWTSNGWEAAAPGMTMVTSIMRAHQILLARVHATLTPFDITFAQYEALMLLTFSSKGRLPLGKIGQRLQVHPASVTNVIDRLEAKGYVTRVPHPDDQRTTLAVISRTGRNVANRATSRLNAEVFEQTGIDDDEQRALIDAITSLRHSAGDFAGPVDPEA